jgi:hypothetical protein
VEEDGSVGLPTSGKMRGSESIALGAPDPQRDEYKKINHAKQLCKKK